MLRKKALNQVGDTIVEVLIAVVVVGLAVGLGYGVASRSLKANRQSQERVEALKQVESQIERLKKVATTDTGGPGGIFTSGTFCLVDGAGGPEIRPFSTPPDLASDPLTATAYAGGQCVQGRYHLSITPSDPNPTTKEFDIRARWFGIGNLPKEETLITYRIYPAPATP